MCRGEDECRLIGVNGEGITCTIRDVWGITSSLDDEGTARLKAEGGGCNVGSIEAAYCNIRCMQVMLLDWWRRIPCEFLNVLL